MKWMSRNQLMFNRYHLVLTQESRIQCACTWGGLYLLHIQCLSEIFFEILIEFIYVYHVYCITFFHIEVKNPIYNPMTRKVLKYLCIYYIRI